MNDDLMRMIELSQKGFFCSQILVIIALEAQGKENADLVRAMSGLLEGVGSCGKICGALTGGACVLGLYMGKGHAGEKADERLKLMINELMEWFENEYTSRYGGIECSQILLDDARNRLTRCPSIVLETLAKIKEILSQHGYSLSHNRDAVDCEVTE